ncbi:ComF family protein [Lutibacter maritimus]|jgi:ComF family protein|uniref:ComF family protein n=1 Tax=Lutibacter maritimus TaxID=593133 RepID=A0A1I6Q9Z2_9FLAO|nr:ComF family protein [Lutibacter maritimus]SFS49178.1 comF family protein [Lutibacter maritimus]
MKILKDIINVFYPDVCFCCKNYLTNNEKLLCLFCRNDLPLTNFSFETPNLVEKTFYGRIPIENGTALFYFIKKGKVQQLIHQLKYNGQQQVGSFIGNWLGEEMISSERFHDIDCIIPVPLHHKKLKKRGYNQVTTFGQSLSKILNIPFYENILKKKTAINSQTKLVRFDRWRNVEELFYIENEVSLSNKHILLIDDIITTGATLEASYLALNTFKNIKISIASMAYTK